MRHRGACDDVVYTCVRLTWTPLATVQHLRAHPLQRYRLQPPEGLYTYLSQRSAPDWRSQSQTHASPTHRFQRECTLNRRSQQAHGGGITTNSGVRRTKKHKRPILHGAGRQGNRIDKSALIYSSVWLLQRVFQSANRPQCSHHCLPRWGTE